MCIRDSREPVRAHWRDGHGAELRRRLEALQTARLPVHCDYLFHLLFFDVALQPVGRKAGQQEQIEITCGTDRSYQLKYLVGQTAVTPSEQALSPTNIGMLEVRKVCPQLIN